MAVIYLLLLVVLMLLVTACCVFLWAAKNNQFENLEFEGSRIMEPDANVPMKNGTGESEDA